MELKIEYLPLEALTPYERNARKHEAADVQTIKNSIKEFEMCDPIGIWGDKNIIVEGHGRLMALKELGHTQAPCIRLDHLTDEQRRAYALAHNKTAEMSSWDFDLIEAEINNINIDMEQFGFEFDDDINVAEIEISPQKLSDKFIIPPFDIFDAKSRTWLDRKKAWNALINDKAQARIGAKVHSNETMNKYKYNGTMENETSILDATLCEIICKWFLPQGENICIDCFAGDTVFGFVSSYLGNKFIGIELRKEQAEFNNDHTNDDAIYYCDDGRNVRKYVQDNSVDLLFSCPPYFDLEVYSDLENDASNQKSYDEFYKILDAAFTEAIKCLKDNRFAVIVCGDVRNKKTGEYYNFPNDIINTFKRNGVMLYNNIKLLTPIGNAQIRCGRYMRSRKTAHIYQDVLVFYKGDTKKINDIFGEVEVEEIESDNE